MWYGDTSKPSAKESYRNGIKHGEWISYYEPGVIQKKNFMQMGKKVARWLIIINLEELTNKVIF